MGHPTGTRVLQDPSPQRAGRWKPALATPPPPPPAKPASCHLSAVTTAQAGTFRHAVATHLREDGYDIRTVQARLGHRNVSTTMLYTPVLNRLLRSAARAALPTCLRRAKRAGRSRLRVAVPCSPAPSLA